MRECELGHRRGRLQNRRGRKHRRWSRTLRETRRQITREKQPGEDGDFSSHAANPARRDWNWRTISFVIRDRVAEWSPRERCDMDKARRVSDWEIANQPLGESPL